MPSGKGDLYGEPTWNAGIESDPQARQWAMFAHLAALSGYIAVPMGNVIGPLIIWLVKKDEHPFVDDQGKESLNFHISMLIYLTVSVVLICAFVGWVTTPVVILIDLIYTILAGLAANRGERYRYPLTIRFIK